jgi:pimeloyl-ACP methyl ester carboxylesterase
MAVSDWVSGFVETNGIRLHYTRTGGAKPPLVLAHGVTHDGMCWSRVAAVLAPDFDVVMVDARGHGRSDAPERGYDPGQQAGDLAGVIAALDLEKPTILGHSMGAATALVLAGTYPDVPGAILLEDPPAWWTDWYDSPDGETRRSDMRTRFLGLKEKTAGALLADQRAEQPGWDEAELQPWVEAKQRFSPNVLEVLGQENPRRVDWASILPRVTCPAMLITADPDLGGIVTAESAAALKSLVPQLEIVHVAGAGHNVRRDQFARYLDIVQGFLAVRKGVATP